MKLIIIFVVLTVIGILGFIPVRIIDGEEYPPVRYQTTVYGNFDIGACYDEIRSASLSKGWKTSIRGRNLQLEKNTIFGQWSLSVVEENGGIYPTDYNSKISWFGRKLDVNESGYFVWHIIDAHTRIQRK